MDVPDRRDVSGDRRWIRRTKREAEIVLICNPRAGGRWKELAAILDSEEASHVRRIVTDSVEDIGPAVSELGSGARLLCIYGGDGTIQRVIDRLRPGQEGDTVIALLGGGTMNVTSRWLGFGRSPGRNFRHVINGFHSGDLHLKEVPLMEVSAGSRTHRGFTFGMGPIVRILEAYERGKKGKAAAVKIAAHAAMAAWFKQAASQELIGLLEAEVSIDGELLPYNRFAALFSNVTGQINPGIEPFKDDRTRTSFYTAAYAVSPREFIVALPFIARGMLPIDITTLLPWNRTEESRSLSTDPRYVNQAVSKLHIETNEPLYTVDGEILYKPEGPIDVTMGPTLKLAVGPNATFSQSLRAAKNAIRG